MSESNKLEGTKLDQVGSGIKAQVNAPGSDAPRPTLTVVDARMSNYICIDCGKKNIVNSTKESLSWKCCKSEPSKQLRADLYQEEKARKAQEAEKAKITALQAEQEKLAKAQAAEAKAKAEQEAKAKAAAEKAAKEAQAKKDAELAKANAAAPTNPAPAESK